VLTSEDWENESLFGKGKNRLSYRDSQKSGRAAWSVRLRE